METPVDGPHRARSVRRVAALAARLVRAWSLRLRRVGLGGLLGGALLAGCASSGADIHLAPLYTRVRSAGGGTEVEVAGGFWTQSRLPGKSSFTVRGLRPLWSRFEYDDGRVTSYFLAPLGLYTRKGRNATSFFFPLFYWQAYEAPDGSRPWDLVAAPGILWSHREFENDAFGWFPVFGNFSNFLTFDHIEFFAFPLYLKTLREGTTSWNLLFPIFNWAAARDQPLPRLALLRPVAVPRPLRPHVRAVALLPSAPQSPRGRQRRAGNQVAPLAAVRAHDPRPLPQPHGGLALLRLCHRQAR